MGQLTDFISDRYPQLFTLPIPWWTCHNYLVTLIWLWTVLKKVVEHCEQVIWEGASYGNNSHFVKNKNELINTLQWNTSYPSSVSSCSGNHQRVKKWSCVRNIKFPIMLKLSNFGYLCDCRYGAKIRFPHALVMTFLFRSGSLQDKFKWIFKAAYAHSKNLATFVFIYKLLMATMKKIELGSEKGKLHPFIAAFIGGYYVFGTHDKINEQVFYCIFPDSKAPINNMLYISDCIVLALKNHSSICKACSWERLYQKTKYWYLAMVCCFCLGICPLVVWISPLDITGQPAKLYGLPLWRQQCFQHFEKFLVA